MSSPAKERPNAENGNLGTRLDSWKEIAAYLGKVERTVKRWEPDRGLPIHRVPGGGRASVFAYTLELDEWLNSKKAQELEEPAEEAQTEEAPVAAVVPFPAASITAPTPVSHHAASSSTRKWLPAIFGLSVIGALSLAMFTMDARKGGLRWSSALPFLSSRNQGRSGLASSNAVSVAEQNQAHDLYLKGRYEWSQRTPDSLNRALDFFTQAIVHDPGYAEAYVGLADTYDLLREYSAMPDNEAYARAIAAARKAVELNDSLAEAHRALAFAEWWGDWDFVEGEKEFRRAIELNPKDPLARKWYANVLSVQGRYTEALTEINKAQELDPTSNSILADKGLLLFNYGRQHEAIELLKQVERSAPEFRSPHQYLMLMSMDLKDYPAYLDEGEKAAEAGNDAVLKDTIAAAREGYARGGERGLLNALYTRQKEYYKAGKLWGTVLARTCVSLGKKQEAVQLLEDAYNRHEWYMLSCKTQRELLTLRDDPRYRSLLAKINFPQPADSQ